MGFIYGLLIVIKHVFSLSFILTLFNTMTVVLHQLALTMSLKECLKYIFTDDTNFM